MPRCKLGKTTGLGLSTFVTAVAILPVYQSYGAIAGLKQVASGLSAPIYVTHAPGDRERLFIVERGGTIRILNLTTGTVLGTPFLSIPMVDTDGEGGLRGMAFDPNYATNGRFYVNVTLDNGGLDFQGATSPFSTHIRRYTTMTNNPNVADPSPTEILSIIQPQSNHNAGWLDFSPVNGYLYIPTGDGGGGGDTGAGHTPPSETESGGNAQDITGNLLGKILRIDVNGDDFPADANRNYRVVDSNPYADVRNAMRVVTTVVPGDDEIWARGMRNPFRDSFDRQTGDLWLGDVGQGSREEIDRQPANAPGGENFGWRIHEGFIEDNTLPLYRNAVYDYDRDNDAYGGTVVSGGYVYRGPDPSLQGKYFFSDSRNSSDPADDNYWMFDPANPYGTVLNIDSLLTPDIDLTPDDDFPVSFGEDAVGNLYVVHLTGGNVYRINTNQLIAGDFNGDGDVDGLDYLKWKANYGSATAASDGNHDGTVNAADYTVWRNNLGHTAHLPGGAAAGVPEPVTMLLFVQLVGALAVLPCQRRRRLGERRIV